MIADSLLQLTTDGGQAIAALGSTAVVSENVIDLSLARDWGQGCPLYLCMTALTDIGAGEVEAVTGANVGFKVSLHASDTATLDANAKPLSYPILATSGIFQSVASVVEGTTVAALYKGTKIYAAINPFAWSNSFYDADANRIRAVGNPARAIYRKNNSTTATCDSKGLRYAFAVVDYVDVTTMDHNNCVWIGGVFRLDITTNVEDPYQFYASGITRV